MTNVNLYNISQIYNNEYSSWRNEENIQKAKRQEFLRRNPDAIKDYDLQRAKILLKAVDLMDKSIADDDSAGTYFESMANIGLGYGAVGGTTLGYLLQKTRFAQKLLSKFIQKNPKSKNILSLSITIASGVAGLLAVYPLYTFLSNMESKINRKRRFDTMEKELQDPKIFVVLDASQKEVFNKNLENIKNNKKKSSTNLAKKKIKNIKKIILENLLYEKKQNQFKEKYKVDKTFYDEKLTEKEIKKAKKDKVLLSVLIKEMNTRSQSYTEKMDKITNNLITLSFALGSLFTLGYERLAKTLKIKHSALPAGLGFTLFIGSTIFGTWAQKRAGHVGKFKAKQELMQNPEQLVYISKNDTDAIENDEIEAILEQKHKTSSFKFLKDFFNDNKEYQKWKKASSLSGKDISMAMKDIEISPEQLQDGKQLQTNMFKTFYKVDKNTQNYSSKIQLANESTKVPITLTLGTIGSVWGMKHLTKLRSATVPVDILRNTLNYIGTVVLFTIPSFLINSYFAKAQKMGARISDMVTMNELEDYRFFADYSRFKES